MFFENVLNVHYLVTNFTDEDWWFQSKRLLIIETKIPEKDLKISHLKWIWMNNNIHFHDNQFYFNIFVTLQITQIFS